MADNKKITEFPRSTPSGGFELVAATSAHNYKVSYTDFAEHSALGTKSGIFLDTLSISGVSLGPAENNWNQVGNTISGDPNPFSASAPNVSLNDLGDILALGCPMNNDGGSNAGMIKIVKNIGGTWTPIGSDIHGPVPSLLGVSVDIDSVGGIVAAGGRDANGGSGIVQVFENNGGTFTQIGSTLSGQAAQGGIGNNIPHFGQFVSLSSAGDFLAVGSPHTPSNASHAGEARVFSRNGLGPDSWEQLVSFTGDNHGYGESLALSADGSVVAIGSFNYGEIVDVVPYECGRVQVFSGHGSNWSQLGADIVGTHYEGNLGGSVDLNNDGTILVAGSMNSTGVTRVFKYNGTNWNQMGSTLDDNGNKVSLNAAGDILGVGNFYFSPGAGTWYGSAKVFNYTSDWIQSGDSIIGAAAYDQVGRSVSLNGAGDIFAVSSSPSSTGIAQVFSPPTIAPPTVEGTWQWSDVPASIDSPGSSGDIAFDEDYFYIRVGDGLQENDEKVIQVSAGCYHGLFLTNSGNVYGCGSNGWGQLGSAASQSLALNPIHITGGGVVAIAAGSAESYFLTEDGELYGCGQNYYGQLGLGGPMNSHANVTPYPTHITGGITGMSMGVGFALFQSGHNVFGCGYNLFNKYGPNTSTYPIFVTGDVPIGPNTFSAGYHHSLFTNKDDGYYYGAGLNQANAFAGASATTNLSTTPNPVRCSGNVSQVAAGNGYSIILDNAGDAFGLGYNGFRSLGLGPTTAAAPSNEPDVRYLTGDVHRVSVGVGDMTKFLREDGDLFTCGSANYGGLGRLGLSPWPGYVASNVTTVSEGVVVGGIYYQPSNIGGVLSLHGTKVGAAFSYGSNISGQLGIGSLIPVSTLVGGAPLYVSGRTDVSNVWKRSPLSSF